ncbi:hypothetical protein SKAU_G00220490 [Synaphobranchus kaupii]|uniref:Uncharacterized protein n=1 Tax=Synaphobranchus kaupii TaxID=118154 RepID=A0A9Q1IUY0_SYNKA|nr:hypothetical protein SKAU_G00220490 [Synaphobranchus kaupii]
MMAGILGRMKTAARGQPCRSPSHGQMRRLKAGSYPLLFPSVISGLTPPLLPKIPTHLPSSAGSTPSPASMQQPFIMAALWEGKDSDRVTY